MSNQYFFEIPFIWKVFRCPSLSLNFFWEYHSIPSFLTPSLGTRKGWRRQWKFFPFCEFFFFLSVKVFSLSVKGFFPSLWKFFPSLWKFFSSLWKVFKGSSASVLPHLRRAVLLSKEIVHLQSNTVSKERYQICKDIWTISRILLKESTSPQHWRNHICFQAIWEIWGKVQKKQKKTNKC